MAGSHGTSVNARTYRPRRNQPRSYPGSDLTRYVCHHHDYVYYPVAWESEGTSYAAGYYDEDGNHYDSVLIKDEQTICKCEYCGSSVKIKWEGGAMPNCPNCGAPISTLGSKVCEYCGTPIVELNIYAWTFSNIEEV